jgi:hypothetical protein
MRSATITLACATVALVSWSGFVHAQDSGTNHGCNGPCDSPQLQQFSWDRDLSHSPDALREAKSWDKAAAKGESAKLIGTLALPCDLAAAERVGGERDVKVYEVACKSGVGYFLVSQPRQKPLAESCFAAEAARAADIAGGAKSSSRFACKLSGGTDVKVMAAGILKEASTACDVRDYRWMGVSAAKGQEYSEVSCVDGHGYVIEVPTTGTIKDVSVVDCQEAIKTGLKCGLTAVTMPVTLQTFRDALKDHAVDCTPAQMRVIGRESVGQRYVVEVQCPQQPQGLVAFIPLQDAPKPFETIDCSAAAARSIQCKLTASQ